METAYQQQALLSANGVELVIALYDGAIRFLYRAIQCVEEGDEIGRRIAVKRALDIVMYLQARLRTDIGGKPAAALADFYAAMFTMTLEASRLASHQQFTRSSVACATSARLGWSSPAIPRPSNSSPANSAPRPNATPNTPPPQPRHTLATTEKPSPLAGPPRSASNRSA